MSAPKLPAAGAPEVGAPDPWENTVIRDLAVGRTVGEYVIRRRIGAGGMGIVYEAEHPQIGKRVAIKVLRPDLSAVRDLLDEARAASAVRHRHIIDVFGFGELSGLGQYLVMEFLEGVPLDEEIRLKAPMTADVVIPILDDTAAALGAAHAKGVVHRDLKPGNLFLVHESGGTRYVKVLDFGLAKAVTGAIDSRERKTREGTTLGTPEYMAPEQAQAKPVDGRTDLYALGVIAFEMLTGRLPFTGENPFQVAVSQVNDLPPAPRSIEGSIPLPLEALVLQLLEKNPGARPPSAEAVRAELRKVQRLLQQEATQAGPVAQLSESARPTALVTPLGSEPPTPLDVAPVEAQAPTTPVLPALAVRRSLPLLPIVMGLAAFVLVIGGYAVMQSRTPELVIAPPPAPVVPAPPAPPAPAEPPPAPAVGVAAPAPAPAPAPVVASRPKPRPLAPGQLQVIARGCTAEVVVDGKSRGWTPQASLSVPAGEHRVKLVNPACTPVFEEVVRVKPGETTKFERQFQKAQ